MRLRDAAPALLHLAHRRRPRPAVAPRHLLPLLGPARPRLLLPPLLLVRPPLLVGERVWVRGKGLTRTPPPVPCSMRYSKMLEESAFHGRRADYMWLLIVSCTLLLVRPASTTVSPLAPSPSDSRSPARRSSARSRPLPSSPRLSPSLCVLVSPSRGNSPSETDENPFLAPPLPSPPLPPSQLVYLWSRLNPLVRLSLFGIITITAPYLPYALCLFSWALSGGGGPGSGRGWGLGVIVSDLLGIAAGHWWCVLRFLSRCATGARCERPVGSTAGGNSLSCPCAQRELTDSHSRAQVLLDRDLEEGARVGRAQLARDAAHPVRTPSSSPSASPPPLTRSSLHPSLTS